MNLAKFDKDLCNGKIQYLAGVDEAGRGPLAGPVVAAAIILPIGFKLESIKDSKKISENKRALILSMRKKLIKLIYSKGRIML